MIMDIQQEVETIKKELVELIVKHLGEHKIEIQTAQKMAADFLAVLPIRDQRDLLTKLKQLGDNYLTIRELYLKELTKINELEREEALIQMRNAITQGNIEHAIAVAKAMTNKPEAMNTNASVNYNHVNHDHVN